MRRNTRGLSELRKMYEIKRRWGRSFRKENVALSGEISVEVGFVKRVPLTCIVEHV